MRYNGRFHVYHRHLPIATSLEDEEIGAQISGGHRRSPNELQAVVNRVVKVSENLDMKVLEVSFDSCFWSQLAVPKSRDYWSILLNVLLQVFTYGTIKSLGVFFNDLMNSIDESNSKISWIILICVFVLAFTANPFAQIYVMYISIRVISGLGYCMSFLPTVTILSQSAAVEHHGVWSLLRPIIIKGPGSPKTITHEPWRKVKYVLEIEKTKTSVDSVDSGVELTTSPKRTSSITRCLAFFATLGFFAPSLYTIPLCISLGTDCYCAAFLLSTMAISELFGGIGAGFVLNREPIQTIYIELICVILLTVSLFVFTFATEL
ncbi:hypothetical protein U0070_002873 [Myodes glareolus]|uniref:Uncharacterized protein n=1 Tax=Myodes glareolus TaxID=447135 RepID=A0AAW0IHW7_MYOGA